MQDQSPRVLVAHMKGNHCVTKQFVSHAPNTDITERLDYVLDINDLVQYVKEAQEKVL